MKEVPNVSFECINSVMPPASSTCSVFQPSALQATSVLPVMTNFCRVLALTKLNRVLAVAPYKWKREGEDETRA